MRARTAGVILLTGWVLLPGVFAFAETAISSAELQQLVTKLQEQITALQTQIVELKSQLVVTQAELKFTKALRRGASGDDVRELQEFLKQYPEIYPEGLVTGFFGALTESAVKRFQEKFNIETEGIVGPKTRTKLNELTTEGAGASGLIPPGLLTLGGMLLNARLPRVHTLPAYDPRFSEDRFGLWVRCEAKDFDAVGQLLRSTGAEEVHRAGE